MYINVYVCVCFIQSKRPLRCTRGIEVGHSFYLGEKYSSKVIKLTTITITMT